MAFEQDMYYCREQRERLDEQLWSTKSVSRHDSVMILLLQYVLFNFLFFLTCRWASVERSK